MATRHDIIHIDFQANAGKANVALKALQQEADRARTKVEGLRTQLQNAKNANMPIADIQKLEAELKLAVKEQKQWQSALNNNLKGVRALDEAVKMFNSGKGSVEGMNAALSKTALNAANLQKSRSTEGSKQWKEMDALAVALEQNIARCNTATNQLVATIKSGGTASKDTLTKAKSDLQQMIALEEQGSKAWVKYTSQLKTVEGALNKITLEEQRMAGQNALKQVFSGQYITKSTSEIEKLIASVKQYQSTIADPEGKGARHFRATETALQKLSAQLGKTKGDIVTVQQALKLAGAAGTANRFGAGLEQQGHKMAQAFRKTTDALNQLQQKRQTYTILQQNGISLTAQEQAMLAKLDAQIATTAARQDKLKAEMVKVSEANNLTTKGISQSIAVLRQQQETVAAGSPAWQKYEAAIASLENRMKIMRGEAISLFDAMRLSQKAGGQGFTGTAKQLQLAEQAIQKAAAGAKKGSAEWQKYQTALAKIRVEMQNAGMTSERMRSILAKPVNAKNLNELQAAVKRAKAELDIMAGTVGKNSKAYTELASQTKKAEMQLKSLQAQSHGTASAFDKAWSRLKTYVGLYMGAAIAIQKVVSTFGTIMELSDRMGEVRKTTGFTADEVGRLTTELKKLDTRTSLTSLMELSSIAGSIGLKTQQQVQGFTEAANMLTVALPEMGNEASRTLMKIADATGDLEKNGGRVKETLEKVGSTIIALRANSAAAAGPITDFVSRVGAVGAQAGISIDQIAALGATVDALGGRVEMSATALSRMIPAIKNNSFAVAQAIGMTEKELKGMTGMEQMVAIFRRLHDSVKDFDMSTEEGMNAAADAVEQMMGKSTSMQEVMKTLNQQGARAGIVFGLLSQNVDMLEKQLGIASNAYEENIALMDEYNKMNDTTAAKWERLKNQLEEFFVGDQAQRWLGGIIDGIRGIVDLLTGNGGLSNAIRSIIVAWGVLKLGIGEAFWKYIILNIAAVGKGLFSLSTTMTAVKNKWVASWKAMDAATKANWIFAIIAAVYMLGKAIYDAATKVSELDKALNELENEESNNEHILNRLVTSYKNVSARVAETTKKHDELEKKTKKLGEEVDRLKKSTDLSSEATETLKKKEEELKKTKEELKKATDENNKANGERLDLIKQINDKYSTYLGYMLSEKTAAEQVASAHQLIISALKEELAQKRLLRSQEAIENKYDEDIQEWRQNSREELESGALTGHKDLQQQVMEKWESVMARISYDTKTGMFTVPVIDGINATALTAKTVEELRPALQTLLSNTMTKVAKEANVDRGFYFGQAGSEFDRAKMAWGGNYGSVSPDDGFGRWTEATLLREQEIQQQRALDIASLNGAHQQTVQDAIADINTNATFISNTLQENQELTNDKIGELARTTNAIVKSIKKYEGDIEDVSQYVGEGNDVTLENAVNTMFASIDANTRKTILAAAKRAANAGTSGTTPTVPTNPYGDYNKVTSPYSQWSGNDLVARRKEMLERVKALANGADVQSVLSEDAKFISEAVRKNIKTTEQAIEWYNTERLKIQDALHAKHLTNTGDWLDPEKVRKRVGRVVQDEMKYYMDELDAYYTERNQEIQRKRNEEEITEGEAWLQTIRNETEWYQRRAELQKLYADKSKEVTQEEQDAIFNIIRERTGETTSFIKADIGKTVKLIEAVGEKSKEAMRRIIGDIDLGVEKDALKSAKSVGKSVKFMADTLAKERPLNGIVDDLKETLAKMGILEGQVPEKMRVLIGEIENAYTTDVKGLVKRIKDAGFEEWARQIEGDTTMQQALMAQLRKAYEAVQEAIRKEASRIKKDADMMWKTILLPDGSNLKQTTDEVLARMTQQQDSVGRANSLIGAGVASDNVATKLAIKQLQLQMSIQRAQFALMRKMGNEKAQYLEQLAKELELAGKLTDAERARKDAANVRKSLELAVTEETKKQQELSNQIAKEQEEAQNRLYTELKEWGDLLASSLQSIFEASAAGNEEYYNELAKLNLTGKGGPGAGTYVVIDNAGTEDATAHYEYLDERQALERQHEIEQENAKAEAWKKVWDDLNAKMNDSITDWMNSFLQSEAIDNNTAALNTLTGAVNGLAGAMTMQGMSNAIQQSAEGGNSTNPTIERIGYEETTTPVTTTTTEEGGMSMFLPGQEGGFVPQWEMQAEAAEASAERQVAAIDKVKVALDSQFQKQQQGAQDANKKMTSSTQSAFAKMTAAANLYGIAYQAMSNDNLSTTQKFEMMAVQAAGQAAISMLTTDLAAGQAKNTVQLPGILGKLLGEMPYPAAIATFAIVTGLLGGLMGLAVSQVTKSKSQIAQATGSSASAGRLATGMLTYAKGNVNEFTDPASLTPGRQYNVDAADGKTYRARYMGKNPKTHITNGPEFHLAGEAGREMIIDAGTTRQITMNEGEIWHAIQTLSNGGRGYFRRRSAGHGGMRAFADGNVEEFSEMLDGEGVGNGGGMSGISADMIASLQASIDRQSDLLEYMRDHPIRALNKWDGPDGIPNMVNQYNKKAARYGVEYI